MSNKRWLILPVFLVGLFSLSCSNGGGPSGPETPMEIPEEEAIAMIPDIINEMSFWISEGLFFADFGPGNRDSEEPVWNGSAWEWTWTDSWSEGGESMSMTYSFWLQYLNAAGTPIEDYSEADSYHLIVGSSMSFAGSEGNFEYLYDYDFQFTGLQSDTANMAGLCEMSMDEESPDGDFYFEMSWYTKTGGVDIPRADGSCPSGGMVWEFTPYELHMDFNDPAGFVSYTLWEGSTEVISGLIEQICDLLKLPAPEGAGRFVPVLR
ncbi:MAG: hypothetical protein QF492_05260 [Candidatus Krumholzibacteria bacterium]|jgi:hypothetical protein|nr:hypothetical protein [Candidatus Krumholzibacteria bacterium]MDP6669297.1 hypothetical protein [Candidatus Krumholzibacteria bacterium]MDP7021520.1 hypothetical protein [Candidatus Krumholzibacteria bacterium]